TGIQTGIQSGIQTGFPRPWQEPDGDGDVGAGAEVLRGSPMVTGTSVLGLKFSGGVILAADTVGSYGSLARFRGISRLLKVNDSTVLGASGDLADFQHLRQLLEQMVIDEELLGDGHSYSPRALHSWLTRVLYNRRSKINPLWNSVLIAGVYGKFLIFPRGNSCPFHGEIPDFSSGKFLIFPWGNSCFLTGTFLFIPWGNSCFFPRNFLSIPWGNS
uniref:Proteasome subunit beta n=1 Tax=Cyanistes caeruleus TaxID=156563 RepID=A0A8C0UA69_CYACU